MKPTAVKISVAAFISACIMTACSGMDASQPLPVQPSIYYEPASSTIPVPQDLEVSYDTYQNKKFGYSFAYPSYMSLASELGSEDGAYFTDPYGGELTVWASANPSHKISKELLDDVKVKAEGVIDSYIDDFVFEINYKGNMSDTSGNNHYYEAAYVNEETIVRFLYKYSAKSADLFKPRARYMAEQLRLLNEVAK